jgi:hypothetical protein
VRNKVNTSTLGRQSELKYAAFFEGFQANGMMNDQMRNA